MRRGPGCEEAISVNPDRDWSRRESKWICLESHRYGLNPDCSPCWLCDPGPVTEPRFSQWDDSDNIVSGLRRGLTEMCVQCFVCRLAHRDA